MKIVSKTSSNAPDILSALLTEIIEEGIKDDASLIHSGRNKIWRKEISGMTIAIKIYGYSPLKSIIYSIRKTKARRAFENARTLIARGIATPFPLAFVEKRGFINRLTGSMYISMYEETEPLEKYIDYGDRLVLDEFARFTALLHSKGILHHDLNATNVRVTVKDTKVTFSLIDINRMKFASKAVSFSLQEKLENLTRFSNFDTSYRHFITTYIKCSNLPTEIIKTALEIKKNHDRKWHNRQRRKNFFKKLFHLKLNE